VILLTVGLEQFPFDRLLRAMDHLVESGVIREAVFGQIGHSRYEPRHFEFRRFLPFDRMRERLQKADTVICHGGVGTILLAHHLGKIPIVFPRRAKFGEQLDDHQLDLVSRLGKEKQVLVAESAEALAEQLSRQDERKKSTSAGFNSPAFDSLLHFLQVTLKEPHGL